jgi:RNA polymerase sigma-70 factor (ECF subfamily)
MKTNFNSIYKTHYAKLYTLAFRMTGNREDAEDILQTSFLNAYRAYEKFRFQSTLYTWLYKIVLNESKRLYKEARRLPAVEYSESHNISQGEFYNHINSFGTTEDNALTAQTKEACLQMFMNCMPSKYRSVFTLRIILQFSVKETAEILEISESTVKVNLHRAKKIIKSHFDGRCSLIKPGWMCDCRKYAKYLMESNNVHHLIDIETIRNKEKAATEEYTSELKEILQIDELYDTTVKPLDFVEFLERVKKLHKEKGITILEY